jgi:hypothetical protein
VGWKTRKIEWWRRHRGPTGQGRAPCLIGGLLLERVPIRSDGSSPTAGLVSFKVIGLGRHTYISCIYISCILFLAQRNGAHLKKMQHAFDIFDIFHSNISMQIEMMCSCVLARRTLLCRFGFLPCRLQLGCQSPHWPTSRKESQRPDMTRTENDMRMNMESHSRIALSEKNTFGSHFVECPPYHAEGETEHLQFLCSWWFVATCTLSASEAAAVEKSESS